MSELISLLIDGKQFQFWENIDIQLSLDSIDSFSFSIPFDKDNPVFRENFQPATYKKIQIRVNNNPILNGIIVSRNTGISGKTLALGGYSAPGVLKDLPVPPDKFPLEFKNQDLNRIASTLAGYYDVEVEFTEPPGASFSPFISSEPGEKILDFLIKLAKKRSLLVSNTLGGKLRFFKPLNSTVVTPLIQGNIPLIDATVDYKEQELFSSVTGFGSSDFGRDPESFTVQIPILKDINRPFIYTVSENEGSDLQKAVEFKAGRLFAGSLDISLEVAGWRGADDQIWKPGDFITLQAPDVFFYNETKLLIRNVSLKGDADSETASLTPVFPGVYSGELPLKMPWE
jgi:prophage tail gpP-like protein